jgi:hypothetical protein
MQGTLVCAMTDEEDGTLRGRLRHGLDSRLAGRLGGETPVPVLIAPPRPQRENGRR